MLYNAKKDHILEEGTGQMNEQQAYFRCELYMDCDYGIGKIEKMSRKN
jgi:hypothetical protein